MPRRERFANDAESILSAAVTAGAGSISVQNAVDFPTAGDFRIIIDNEIMIVTAVSGSTFTVTRGAESTSDTNHVDGSQVAQIITKDSLKRYMADWGNPLTDVVSGFPHQLQDASDVLLTTTDFAWTNQGSATDVAQSNGGILFTIDSAGTDSARLYLRTLTAPWKVTCALTHLWLGGSTPSMGMCVVDNTVGNFKAWGPQGIASYKRNRWTNTTTVGATQQDFTSFGSRSKIWLQIEDDNTDHFFRISMDGVNFLTVAQETRGTFTITPDRVGLFLNNLNTGQDMLVNLHSWIEE